MGEGRFEDGVPMPFGRLQEARALAVDDPWRVDFDKDEFEVAIATHGYRLAWQRRTDCPCPPVSYQLTQPGPNCPMCEGTGDLYFGPPTEQDLGDEVLSDVQLACLRGGRGFMVRALMAPITSRDKRNDKLGSWMYGGASATVVAENRLGFRDRLINLDAAITYNEVVVMPAGPARVLPLRYLVTEGVYLCRDQAGHDYVDGRDFTIRTGKLAFLPGRGPQEGHRLTCHYVCFPCFLVEDFNHRERLQYAQDPGEGDGGPPASPTRVIQRLPTQAMLSLEFIPGPNNDGGR